MYTIRCQSKNASTIVFVLVTFFNHCLNCHFLSQVCTMHGCSQLVHCDILVQHCPPLHLDKFNELLRLFKLLLQYVYFNIHPRIRFLTFSSICSWEAALGHTGLTSLQGLAGYSMMLIMVATMSHGLWQGPECCYGNQQP